MFDLSLPHISTIFEHYSQQTFTPKIWDDIIDSISMIYNRDEKINTVLDTLSQHKIEKRPSIFPLEKFSGSFCDLNKKIINQKVVDVLEIDFEHFYPNIIIRLCDEEVIELNGNMKIFYLLYKNYKELRILLTIDGKRCFKTFINFFYGKMDPNDRELVTGRGYLIMQCFTDYDGWLYSDTCHFFIKDKLGVTEKIEENLKHIDMPYEITFLKEILVIAKKRIVTIDRNSIGKISGYLDYKGF